MRASQLRTLPHQREIAIAEEMREAQRNAAAKALECPSALKLLEVITRELKEGRRKSIGLLETGFEDPEWLKHDTIRQLLTLIRHAKRKPAAPIAEKLANLKLSSPLMRAIARETRIALEEAAESLRRKRKRYSGKLRMGLKRIEETAKAIAAEEAHADRARNELAASHARLAAVIARRYAQGGTDSQDLVQEAYIALLQSAERYNPHRDCRFATYFYRWVIHAAARAAIEQKGAIHAPPHAIESLGKIARATAKLLAGTNGRAGVHEITEQTGIPEERVIATLKQQWNTRSLDEPLQNNDGGLESLYETIEDKSAPDPFEIVAKREEMEALERLIEEAGLSSKERRALEKLSKDRALTKEEALHKAAAIRKLKQAKRTAAWLQ